jgi:hypothetical protein
MEIVVGIKVPNYVKKVDYIPVLKELNELGVYKLFLQEFPNHTYQSL